MVNTLQQLGISETDFIQECDASFKQASKFCQWVDGSSRDHYYHPFSMPEGFDEVNSAPLWNAELSSEPFAKSVSLQAHLCEHNLAPKQAKLGDFASIENYGYHLDAGKFAKLLTRHCCQKLGVTLVKDNVVNVNANDNGDITSVDTQHNGQVNGDLFIDCSGTSGLLINQHFNVPFVSKSDVLFIDKALAVQVPYQHADEAIQSATVSTAQTAGWIWDIGLPTRRGVGHVYSSKYVDKNTAIEQLKEYLRPSVNNVDDLTFRELTINPGHRESFWVNNCVAVGMASGFLEPLEASALVMVETAAKTIALHMPASRAGMDVVAKRYNENMLFRWERIIDFLKLHYVLSKRTDSDFWIDNRKTDTIPDSLQDLLTLWQYQTPANNGFLSPYDLFPAASYQYILYGMGFKTETNYLAAPEQERQQAKQQIHKVQQRKAKVLPLMPSNRQLLNELSQKKTNKLIDLALTGSASCKYIKFEDIAKVATSLPVFIKQEANENWSFVALTGLELNEKLIDDAANADISALYQRASCTSLQVQECNDYLNHVSLLEPVNLDITFNDQSSLMLKGLFVFSQDAIKRLSDKEQQLLSQQSWAPIITSTLNSLSHIPKLIDLKNQQLSHV